MAVELTVSRSSSGAEIQDFLSEGEKGLNHGNVATNTNTLEEVLYITHDGTEQITGLAIYIENATELLEWADVDVTKGLLADTDNDGVYDYTFKTGVGDGLGTAIALGDLAPATEKVIRLKIVVPGDEDEEGIRKFDIKFDYTYTI